LQAAGVDRILHAGDISAPQVIADLAQVAPVDYVKGNRDWRSFRKTSRVQQLQIGGIRVALMHGHISWFHYVFDKFMYLSQGYRFNRYLPFLLRAGNGARVIVFGHTHHAENVWQDGKLLFNPGSAGFGFRWSHRPSWGLLKFYADGRVEGAICPLEGYRLENRTWQKSV
jgi:putative phosphoesterase